MNKFNLPRRNIQKERRQKRTERRKQKSRTVPEKASSDGSSNPSALALKVSSSTHSPYMSGKNRAKLQKKWRRAQKEALQSGLVTLQDIEMLEEGEAGTDDSSMEPPSVPKSKATKATKFFMKKGLKVRSKSAGRVSEPVAVAVSSGDGDDVMMQ